MVFDDDERIQRDYVWKTPGRWLKDVAERRGRPELPHRGIEAFFQQASLRSPPSWSKNNQPCLCLNGILVIPFISLYHVLQRRPSSVRTLNLDKFHWSLRCMPKVIEHLRKLRVVTTRRRTNKHSTWDFRYYTVGLYHVYWRIPVSALLSNGRIHEQLNGAILTPQTNASFTRPTLLECSEDLISEYSA